MSDKIYGTTTDARPINDEMIEELSQEAERSYNAEELSDKIRGRGRPPLGEHAKIVESVRLEPIMRDQVARRAAADGVSVSEVIRRALGEYMRSSNPPMRKARSNRARRRR